MSSQEIPPPARAERWLLVVPVVVALGVHVVTLGSGLVLDDRVLEGKPAGLASLDLRYRFLDGYLGPERVDPGYQPLTYLTLALESALGLEPRGRHAVNLALHATAAALVFLVLRELLESARLAAAGAALFAALPIGVDAVARILGRADILAALALLVVWSIGLREPRLDPRRRLLRSSAVALVTLAGLFAHERAAAIAPVLLLVSAWCLGHRVPWAHVAAASSAVLGHLAISSLVLEGRPGLISPLANPLADLPDLQRAAYGAALLGDYAATTVLPLQLSADHGRIDIDLPPAGNPAVVVKLGLGAVALAATLWARRRGAPVAVLATVSFLVILLPHLNVLDAARTAFAERSGYLAAAAYPLLLCAILDRLVRAGRWRGRWALLLIAGLVLPYAGRAIARGRDWLAQDDDPARLVHRPDVEARARDLFLSLEGLIGDGRAAERRRHLLERAAAEADFVLARAPDGGWGEALRGAVILETTRRHDEGISVLTRAEALLAARSPPVAEPHLYKLRGNAYLYAGKIKEALADFELNLVRARQRGQRPDAMVLARRGNCRGQLGDLQGALADFNAAIAEAPELPELWNNRGFCSFQMGDIRGAINDYGKGYELCVKKLVAYLPPPADSQHGFLLKLADIYGRIAAGTLQTNFVITREAAAARAALCKDEAARLVPSRGPQK